MHWLALPLALLPALLHWWWTRSVFEPSASAVLPERHLAVAQRVSFVTILCMVAIVMIARWHATWILPAQFVALTATTYRTRRAMFGETWPYRRYLSWRVRVHIGMFGLWYLIALAPALIAQANPQMTWWLSAVTIAMALAWHHWNGRILLLLLGATPLARPDLEVHFQRVFAAARVPTPALWRAGATGAQLANAFALVTLAQRGVLFFDSLLEQLPAEEVTAILAHEVAHLEQFHRRRLLTMYFTTTMLIVLLMLGTAVTTLVAPGVESWWWAISFAGVFGAMMLRARRMQAHETDADLRAIELCGDPEALIRGLIRIYEINHIPRRWSAVSEERATHPSLARRIRTIRDRTATTHPAASTPDPIERLVVASSEVGRCVVLDRNRIAFVWMDGLSRRSQAEADDPATILERANRVEMIAYDQLGELRLSAKHGAIDLVAVGRQAGRWSMRIDEADAARVQAALDGIDHLVVTASPPKDFSIARRFAVLIAVLLTINFSAIGAVIVPALLALRRPKRPLMLALAAALAGTAIASVNELDVTVVRVMLLGILTAAVLWSVRRPTQQEPQADAPLWTWIERVALCLPVLVGLIFAAANGRDLFGLHSAIRDRGWFTAALAALAVFYFVQTGQRTARRAGLGVAVLATASFVIGSPWFLLHAVADPLIADMPMFREISSPAAPLAERAVSGHLSSLQIAPDGNVFLLGRDYEQMAEYDGDGNAPFALRFVAGGFDGWTREIRAFDAAIVDDQRLLVLDHEGGSSHLRAEEIRSGRTLWTMSLPDISVSRVQAAPDGRWRAFGRRGHQFKRIDGRIGTSPIASTQWTVVTDKQTYVEMPLNDGGSAALAVTSLSEEPSLSALLTDWRETKRLLRVDSTSTTEIATSQLRVDCTKPPIDVTGNVCVSFDGRSSWFWQVDLATGRLLPLAEARSTIWNLSQPSQHRLAGVANGEPMVADLKSRTLVRLIPNKYCWAQDVGVTHDVVVTICGAGRGTTVTKYLLTQRVHE